MLKEQRKVHGGKIGSKYGGIVGQAIGQHREYIVLAWLARWRYSVPEVLSVALNYKSDVTGEITPVGVSAKLAKLIKRGWVRKCRCNTIRHGFVYQLTAAGIAQYKTLNDRELPGRMTADKILLNTQVPHELGAQLYVAFQLKNITEYFTPSEILRRTKEILEKNKKSLTTNTYASPDALIIKNGVVWAVEYEWSQKNQKKMMGKYQDMTLSKEKIKTIENGVLDKHRNAMSSGVGLWSEVIFIQLGDVASKTYTEFVKRYFKAFSGVIRSDEDEENRKIWINSFHFETKTAQYAKKHIYQKPSENDLNELSKFL